MERRELLKLIAAATGVAVVGGEFLLSGCNNENAGTTATLSDADIALLDEVGEVIIPAATTPGAKGAEVGKFMKTMAADCMTEKQQQSFTAGISSLKEACKKMHNKDFAACSADEKKSFVLSLEKEAKDFNSKNDETNKAASEKAKAAGQEYEDNPPHYYSIIKQLTLFGYFTSEPGCTKQLRSVPVPGKYDGAYPYKKGEHAFSE